MADPAKDDPKGSDKTLTQEQVDKIVEERLARERKKFEDYDDLKAQVEELKTAAAEKSKEADAKKSESEKLAEQLQQLQSGLDEERKAREKAEFDSLRTRVAAEKGVPANLLTGSTQEEIEEAADALLEFRGEPAEQPSGTRTQPRLKSGNTPTGEERSDDPLLTALKSKVGAT